MNMTQNPDIYDELIEKHFNNLYSKYMLQRSFFLSIYLFVKLKLIIETGLSYNSEF